ncbi:MAG: hypothetical protein U0Q21_07665 [Dermatophilaceae bacterium]
MRITRRAGIVAATGALMLAGATGAQAAEDSGATARAAAPTTCTIHAYPPYLSGGLIKGDGDLTCTANVYGLQARFILQEKFGLRWVDVGVPARGTRYNVIKIWGTAYVGYSHGIFRTKSTGKVQFYGDPTWYPVKAVSAPRST